MYNGLVPNLIVCMLGVRAFFRQQWQARVGVGVGVGVRVRVRVGFRVRVRVWA